MSSRTRMPLSRRDLLRAITVGSAAGLVAPALAPEVKAWSLGAWGQSGGSGRSAAAFDMRYHAAAVERDRPPVPADTNGDETRYASRCASHSKGLPHDENGEVDPEAYKALLAALESGKSEDFRKIPMAGPLRLVNPQGAYTFALEGADPHRLTLPAPPAFASAEAAADLIEVYWQALLRDVPFAEYAESEVVSAACEDLARCSGFAGASRDGRVVPDLLFRGPTPGDANGPYVSQFLYAAVPQGVYTLEQRFRVPAAGTDYCTTAEEWLALQRGSDPPRDAVLQTGQRYIRTGRDLARYVQKDFTYQPFLNAALILLRFGDPYLAPTPYLQRACAAGPSDFFRLSPEVGFCTFGAAQILHLVASVANHALHAAWRQKWLLHRRLRPEEFAFRVDRTLNHGADYPVHEEIGQSAVLDVLTGGSAILPMAYPEGSPAHPSYPGGHAAIAGACATVLKVFFREDAPFPGAVGPARDGLSLVPIDGRELTVGGEINKLASNVAFGRNFAGIHYRSDAAEGLRLGEEVALAYLADARSCLTENFDGFVFTSFGGKPVEIR